MMIDKNGNIVKDEATKIAILDSSLHGGNPPKYKSDLNAYVQQGISC